MIMEKIREYLQLRYQLFILEVNNRLDKKITVTQKKVENAIESTDIELFENPVLTRLKVTSDILKIRKSPKIRSRAFDWLYRDDVVTTSKNRNGWYYIDSKGGWVNSKYVEPIVAPIGIYLDDYINLDALFDDDLFEEVKPEGSNTLDSWYPKGVDTLPLREFNILTEFGGSTLNQDILNDDFIIDAVQMEVDGYCKVIENLNIRVADNYDNTFNSHISYDNLSPHGIEFWDNLIGIVDFNKGTVSIDTITGLIKKVRFKGTIKKQMNVNPLGALSFPDIDDDFDYNIYDHLLSSPRSGRRISRTESMGTIISSHPKIYPNKENRPKGTIIKF